MFKFLTLFLSFITLCSTSLMAGDFVALDFAAHETTNQNGVAINTFIEDELIEIKFDLQIPDSDIGLHSSLFLVAETHGQFFMMDKDRNWHPWNFQRKSLLPYAQKVLQKNEVISVLNRERVVPGEYLAYAGYLNRHGEIIYDLNPATLFVFADTNSPLVPVRHKATLNEFLINTQKQSNIDYFLESGDFSTPVASPDNENNVSQTNLQESGVDEADRIKVVGNQLFALQNCVTENRECLALYEIKEIPAENNKMAEISFDPQFSDGRIYYYQNKVSKENKRLIRISTRNYYYAAVSDRFLPNPGNNQTDVQFIDITADNALKSSTRLTFDGSLSSSRLVDDTLYLVTQYHDYAVAPVPMLEDDTRTTAEKHYKFPQAMINQQIEQPLFNAQDCYITPRDSNSQLGSSIVSIIEIPLQQPENFKTSCIAGTVETLYASTQALYLASSRFSYHTQGNAIFYPETMDYFTDIHKFSFSETGLKYKASGRVSGHFGWEEGKKSFRMGEHRNILKVATSLGQDWNNTASTRVTVLEDDEQGLLKQVGFLEKLGKPGERLYAARFIGDRGFLVTFKVTDPLIMLDFSVASEPKVLGELEIEGFSDYLHIVDENYLLGVGKDAMAGDQSERDAWYQGLKLSLFDISNPAKMFEVNHIILGKRGTTSPVLEDHHALAWLPGTDGKPDKLAIPVALHEGLLNAKEDSILQPWAYYNWTHTGLYTFTINTSDNPGIRQSGQLLTEQLQNGDQQPNNARYDRAIFQGNTVHYVHENQVFSQELGKLQ